MGLCRLSLLSHRLSAENRRIVSLRVCGRLPSFCILYGHRHAEGQGQCEGQCEGQGEGQGDREGQGEGQGEGDSEGLPSGLINGCLKQSLKGQPLHQTAQQVAALFYNFSRGGDLLERVFVAKRLKPEKQNNNKESCLSRWRGAAGETDERPVELLASEMLRE